MRGKLLTFSVGLIAIVAVTSISSSCAPRAGQSNAPQTSPEAGQVLPGDRWPSASDAASWTVTQDEAIRIARAQLDGPSSSYMQYAANPVVRANPREHFWRVSGTSLIAGGWEAEVDARSGSILRSRFRAGR